MTVGLPLPQRAPVVPYARPGRRVTSYKEESEVAGEAFNETSRRPASSARPGLEDGRGTSASRPRWATPVPNAIGVGGVSKVYGEDDLGGTYAIGKLIVAF